MTTEPAGKVCVVCHADCSNKPRTKDAQGRYYCKPCYDEALAKRAAAKAQPAPAARARAAPSAAVAAGGSTSDIQDFLSSIDDTTTELFNEQLSTVDQVAPPPPSVRMCPKCHAVLAGSAAICVQCGTNVATGAALRTKKLKAPGKTTIWPWVLGGIFTLMGGLALAGAVFNMTQGGTGGAIVGSIVSAGIQFWTLSIGVMLLRRSGRVLWHMRVWGGLNFALSALAATCFGLLGRALSSAQLTDDPAAAAAASAVVGVLIAWFVGWALFGLFVFWWAGRSAVVEEAGRWR